MSSNGFFQRQHLQLIFCAYLATMLSLASQLTPLIFALTLFCLGWRLGIFLGRLKAPSPWLNRTVTLVAASATLGLVASQGLFSVMLHLIMLGYTLKFLELTQKRDINVFICTGFILVATFFVFHTQVYMALWGLVLMALHLIIALALYGPRWQWQQQGKILGKLVLVSLPLCLVLFIVFPRLPPVWKLPQQKGATTGLSDSVSLGDIAKLSRSSELAFRASFEQTPPNVNQRYWRAMTMSHYDGTTWSQSLADKQQANARSSQVTKTGKGQSYQVVFEPSYQTWLPSLTLSQADGQGFSVFDGSLRSEKIIAQRRMFDLTWYPDASLTDVNESQRRQYITLPAEGNPQARQWAAQLKQSHQTASAQLDAILTTFTQAPYRYTLSPPQLGASQIDDFLFNSKAGFCVHYASSFVFMARSLGLPSRMVTGYQGGEWDENAGFITVRQYDAHAWAEVWLDGKWQRFDPTAYVSPERVDMGLESALPDEFLAGEMSLLRLRNNAMINQLYLAMAKFDYAWSVWVLNYNSDKQLRLLSRWFGSINFMQQAWLFVYLFATALALMVLFSLKPWQRPRLSALDKQFYLFEKAMGRHDLQRQTGETVSDFCKRIGHSKRHWQSTLTDYSRVYNRAKYGQVSEVQYAKEVMKLKWLLSRLK
ncbi:transglutaminase family protein [Motilimonas pumila]|nr:DUF3488 and transglutaminase-like domain-containing protein [Motilimonas pumila]